MSVFGNDVKDEVYRAIKNFFEEGYKISELMNILRYVFEEYEFEKEFSNDKCCVCGKQLFGEIDKEY